MDRARQVFANSPVNNNMGSVVIVFILVIIMIYVILYVYRQYNNTSLKTTTMVKKPVKVPSSSLKNISASNQLPENVNGKEFSYSLWMYIDAEDTEITSNNKLVMARMNSSATLSQASPIFSLDRKSNKLHVYTKKENAYLGSINDIDSFDSTLTIPYVPLQRWVNIIMVVDNNFLQLFMDGELREVKDLSQFETYDNRSSVVSTPVGDVVIGSMNEIPSFNGYVSKVQVFNYALTLDHAKFVYKAGPLHKSILGAIGVPYYGLQSPFYRIDEKIADGDEKCTA